MSSEVAATVVSPLGSIDQADPLSFDSGPLQRGVLVSGGAGEDSGRLQVALETPFFRELSVRVGWEDDLWFADEDGHRISWRLRLPVIQALRAGRLDVVSVQVREEVAFGKVDPFSARHEVSYARVSARSARSPGTSRHSQVGVIVRSRETAGEHGRVGLVVRQAAILNVLPWQATTRRRVGMHVSVAELDWRQLGLNERVEGRLSVAFAAPSVDWRENRRQLSFGVWPLYSLTYQPGMVGNAWAGQAMLRGTFAPGSE
jgi:hypothetical protein